MTIYTTPTLETTLDAIGISLCCVIISFLIYNRIKYNQMVLNRKSIGNINSFNTEVAVKVTKQQSKRTFDTIYDMINEEKRKFKRLTEKEELKNAKNFVIMLEKGQLIEKVMNIKAMEHTNCNIMTDTYDELSRLFYKGLDAQKISEELGIPIGEIELFLKGNKKEI